MWLHTDHIIYRYFCKCFLIRIFKFSFYCKCTTYRIFFRIYRIPYHAKLFFCSIRIYSGHTVWKNRFCSYTGHNINRQKFQQVYFRRSFVHIYCSCSIRQTGRFCCYLYVFSTSVRCHDQKCFSVKCFSFI